MRKIFPAERRRTCRYWQRRRQARIEFDAIGRLNVELNGSNVGRGVIARDAVRPRLKKSRPTSGGRVELPEGPTLSTGGCQLLLGAWVAVPTAPAGDLPMTADQNARGELLRRFFSGATEHAFVGRMGVADPPLVDYVAEMLVRFVKSDAIYGVRNPRGERLMQVSDMLAEAQARQGTARREMHRHIGDFTLFWTGVYPEIAERMRQGRKDSLLDYHDQGKRNYLLASTLPAEDASAPDAVLKRLSDNFELCVYGLGEVRRQWSERDGEIEGPILLG
jgi:hypothetical protein